MLAALLAAAAMLPAEARRLDAQEALRRAEGSTPSAGPSTPGARPAAEGSGRAMRLVATGRAVASDGTPAYYIFKTDDGDNALITTADDRLRPVLGRLDNASDFDSATMPPAMAEWLEEMAREQQAFLATDPAESDPLSRAPGSDLTALYATLSPIEPLVKTKWDQGSPYNDNCPIVNNKRSMTGCVATAMAQILYYHKWANCGGGTATNVTAGTTYTYNFTGKTFDWDAMTPTYGSSSTAEAKAAVADLMYACGMAVDMRYSPSGSGALNCVKGIVNYFGYDPATREVNRADYPAAEWEKMVYDYISTYGPLAYSGRGNGGHAFILDGYDTDGYFHFNWGWSGSLNGYYCLTALNPGNNPEDNYLGGYTGSQAMVRIYKPTDEGKPEVSRLHPHIYETEVSNGAYSFLFFTAGTDPKHTVNVGLMFFPDKSYTGGEFLNSRSNASQLGGGLGTRMSTAYDFPACTFKAGQYYVKPAVKFSDGEIILMAGGNSIIATVAANGSVTYAYEIAPRPIDVTASIASGASIYMGSKPKVTFTLTNRGTDVYNDDFRVVLTREVANPDAKDEKDDPFVTESFDISYIPALVEPGDNVSITVPLSFTGIIYNGPFNRTSVEAGTYDLKIYPDYGNALLSIPVTIKEGTDPAGTTTTPTITAKEVACGDATLLVGEDGTGSMVLTGIKNPVATLDLSASAVTIDKIAPKAFERDNALSFIVIPATVKEIGSNAFRLCGKLSIVVFEGTTPPFTTPEGLFYGIADGCTFTVPAGSLDSYTALLDGFGTVSPAIEEIRLPEGLADMTVSFAKERPFVFNEWMNIYMTEGTFFTYPATDNVRLSLKADASGSASSFTLVDAKGKDLTKALSTGNLDRIELESRLADLYITTDDGITDVNDKTTVHAGTITVEAHGNPAFTEMTDAPLKSLRGRGNSTLGFPKKPYRIQFGSKTALHSDLKKSKNYVLLANYKDGTLMRNTIASWIGQALDIPYTTHMIPVNVWLNGAFKGSYTLCEKTGINSGHIDDIDETEGILLELDTNIDPTDIYFTENGSKNIGPFGFPVCVKDPDFQELIDDGSLTGTADEHLERWKGKFLELENALAGKNGLDWTDLIDLESAVKYVMVFNLTSNQELRHPKSVFIHARSFDEKFEFGHLWDFDWAYNGGDITNPETYFFDGVETASGSRFFLPIVRDPRFQAKYAEIWAEFVKKLPELVTFMGEYAGQIESSAAENTVSEQNTRPGAFRRNVETLKDWLVERAAFISTADNFGLFSNK